MDAQTTTHAHPDRAYGNIVRPTKRPADSPDVNLFSAGMPRSYPRPPRRRLAAPASHRATLFQIEDGPFFVFSAE